MSYYIFNLYYDVYETKNFIRLMVKCLTDQIPNLITVSIHERILFPYLFGLLFSLFPHS